MKLVKLDVEKKMRESIYNFAHINIPIKMALEIQDEKTTNEIARGVVEALKQDFSPLINKFYYAGERLTHTVITEDDLMVILISAIANRGYFADENHYSFVEGIYLVQRSDNNYCNVELIDYHQVCMFPAEVERSKAPGSKFNLISISGGILRYVRKSFGTGDDYREIDLIKDDALPITRRG